MSMEHWTEPDLLRAFRKTRDEAAFRELVRRHLARVMHVALRRLGDRQAAEEVAQNVFVKFARKAPSLEANSVVGAWLHRVTVQETADFNRKEYRRRRAMKNFHENQILPNASKATPAIDEALLDGLDEALGKLSTMERAVVMLRFESGMRFKEIAQRLGKSEEAARKQVARALKKLALRLGRQSGGTISTAALATALPLAFGKPAAASPALVGAVVNAALTASTAPVTITSIICSIASIVMQSKITLLLASAAALFLISFFSGRQAATGFEGKLMEQTYQSVRHRAGIAARADDAPAPSPDKGSEAPDRTVAQIMAEAAALARENASSTSYRLRLVLDELSPDDYEAAIAHLETLRDEDDVFQRLGSMLAGLWAYQNGESGDHLDGKKSRYLVQWRIQSCFAGVE